MPTTHPPADPNTMTERSPSGPFGVTPPSYGCSMLKDGSGTSLRESTALAGAAPQTAVLARSADTGPERKSAPVAATPPANIETESTKEYSGHDRQPPGSCCVTPLTYGRSMLRDGAGMVAGDNSAPAGAAPPAAASARNAGFGPKLGSAPVGAAPPTSAASSEAGAVCGAEGVSGGVRVDAVDVAGLCGPGLRARLGEIARAESRLAAMKADTLGEIARRSGDGAAAHAATHEMAVSGRKARGEVREAVRLGELDATRAGLAEGTVPVGHAQLIARAAGDAPVDEAMLAALAQREGYDEFRRTVARHVADVSSDDGKSVLERQRQARTGTIRTRHSDGMTVVHLEVDPLTGARLGTVIAAAERRLFRNEDRAERRTPPQRTADAITQIMLDPGAKRHAGASLIVVADYDILNRRLTNGRLADGTPVPIAEIAKIAVDAQLLPTIFEAATGDLRMGRANRTATDIQRAALALRDKGCVGCGIPPERCQHHHIEFWRHDGHTDYWNLVTVCPDCHNDKIHQQGFTVEWNPNHVRFGLQPPKPPNGQPPGAPTGRQTGQPAGRPSDGTHGRRGPRAPPA